MTLLAGTLIALPGNAMLITGSFDGIASGQTFNPWEGTITPFAVPVSGSFSFETTIPDSDCCPPVVEPGSLLYQGQVFDFAVHVFDRDTGSGVIDDYWEDGVTLLEEGAQQSVRLGGGGPYWYWSMTFVDPDGGLFENFDPETFDPREVDVDASSGYFSDDIRSYYATLDFDSLVFDGYPRPVPEPAPLGLFGAGLLALAVRRRRLHRDSRVCREPLGLAASKR